MSYMSEMNAEGEVVPEVGDDDLVSDTTPKIGDRVSVEITTFVFGTIDSVNAAKSAEIRLDVDSN
jgi:hypothetical protein